MKKYKDGIWIAEISGVQPGDEYRYRIINNGEEYLKIDPYARNTNHSIGNAIITKPPEDQFMKFEPPSLNKMIIYELHIGTFGKMDGERGPGTLEGAIERLSYLKDLGVNTIEIMPVAEFPGGYSWGYNPSHIFAIETDYGTPGTFREFINKAHRLGIAVIIDVVYNHLGPGDLDLWQFDGWHENEKGGIYFFNDWRAQTPWGDTRPDYGRKEVREYIRDNALMWLREYNIDGMRWDSTLYIRNVFGRNNDPDTDIPEGWSLMQWVNEEIKKAKPSAMTIAEDLQNNPYLTKSQKDAGAGFDTQWSASFVHVIRETLIAPQDEERDMYAVRDAIMHRYYLDAFERVIYTESHDEVANGKARVPEEVDPGKASSWQAKKKSALGAVMVFTSPGIPMLFQGQEFLEDDWFHDRDPIDWSKKERFAGIYKLYKNLIALRLNKEGNTQGLCGQEVDVYHVNNNDKVIAYHRWDKGGPGDSVVIVVNFSFKHYKKYKIGMPASGKWKVRFNGDKKEYDHNFGGFCCPDLQAGDKQRDDMPAYAKVEIAPYSALILSQEK